jgi:hypothetical protein
MNNKIIILLFSIVNIMTNIYGQLSITIISQKSPALPISNGIVTVTNAGIRMLTPNTIASSGDLVSEIPFWRLEQSVDAGGFFTFTISNILGFRKEMYSFNSCNKAPFVGLTIGSCWIGGDSNSISYGLAGIFGPPSNPMSRTCCLTPIPVTGSNVIGSIIQLFITNSGDLSVVYQSQNSSGTYNTNSRLRDYIDVFKARIPLGPIPYFVLPVPSSLQPIVANVSSSSDCQLVSSQTTPIESFQNKNAASIIFTISTIETYMTSLALTNTRSVSHTLTNSLSNTLSQSFGTSAGFSGWGFSASVSYSLSDSTTTSTSTSDTTTNIQSNTNVVTKSTSVVKQLVLTVPANTIACLSRVESFKICPIKSTDIIYSAAEAYSNVIIQYKTPAGASVSASIGGYMIDSCGVALPRFKSDMGEIQILYPNVMNPGF